MATVLITGANRGIGFEFVRQYSSAGYRVHACYRSPERSEDLIRISRTPHSNVIPHQIDLSRLEEVDHLAGKLSNETLDILINNAGVFPDKGKAGYDNIHFADWGAAFVVNTLAPIKMATAFSSHLAKSEQKKIVFITSRVASIQNNSEGTYYIQPSSKAALNMAARSLTHEMTRLGISTAIIEPGWVKSDMGGANAPVSVEESVSEMRKLITALAPANSGRFLSYRGNEIPW